ncbi:MAG: serine/threonine-protein kinase [Planctomycetota bacterium]|jgi:serine/threonine-protein kinase
MSGAEGKGDKEPDEIGAGPTRSFDGSVKAPGGQLGPFRIERELGRGAVGVVYLAHDTKLDRPVAIKSLPAEVMGNAKARSRFAREAKVLASLNHPNIGTIYEQVEEAEGVCYLILEYIPGQTLAERIAKGPLKLQETLTIALQIAEAVAAAHEHDVIHRDLKPGNIKITPEGKVKVLDFGLAKAVGGEALDEQTTITQPGRVIGTPAYMSPEQARGKPTDKRSDIWSFGCVLYEMLTGRIPFKGETVSDTLANILQTDPEWQALPQSIPATIQSLLRHCLRKDPRQRLRDMGDASIEISETLSLLTVTVPTVEKLRPARLRRLMVGGAACLLVGAVAASLVTWKLKRPSVPPSQPVRHFVIHPEMVLGFEALWHHALALSPNGKRLVYIGEDSAGRRKLYVRELDEPKARPLPGTESAISPFFSPDGEWIGFADHFEGKLKKVSVKGGAPFIFPGECRNFSGGSWGADDSIIFAPGGTDEDLWRVSASGEGLERLTMPDPNQGEVWHFWPQILPGGKAVLFTDGSRRIRIYSLETGKRQVLFKDGTYARYVSTGHIIYARKETLYAVPFDIEQLKVVGSGVPVVPDVIFAGSQSAQFAIARDGTLVYVPVQARRFELRPVWVDRQGRVELLPGVNPGHYWTVAISPDGMQLAFSIADGDNFDIWIYDLMRHTLNPLTSNGKSWAPIWAPDGKSLIFKSGSQLYEQRADGTGEPELLAEARWHHTSCSPDGRELLTNNGVDIGVVPLKQNEKSHPRPFIERSGMQRQAVWSPDGRWVAYSSDETRWWEVYVGPYPGPGPKVRISTEGGYQPMWSRDGKELFYRSGDKMMAATIETEPEFKVTGSEVLFEGQYLMGARHNYDVAPDGRFLMIQQSEELTPPCIHVVLNWFEELKRLVPTGKN